MIDPVQDTLVSEASAPEARGQLRPPAYQFYWARIDGLPKRVGGYALGAAFERWIPQPIEEVETRYIALADKAYLACGISKNRLQALIDAEELHGNRVESIKPIEVPGIVLNHAEDPDPDPHLADRFEFRSGFFESPRRRRARGFKAGVLVFSSILVTAVLVCGLVGAARADSRDADAARAAVGALASNVLGEARGANATLDPALRLGAALRLAEATRSRGSGADHADDRSMSLLQLLDAWPETPATRVIELRVDQDQIVVRSQVKSAEDGESLALAIDASMTDWALRSHGVNKARDLFEATAVFVPAQETKP